MNFQSPVYASKLPDLPIGTKLLAWGQEWTIKSVKKERLYANVDSITVETFEGHTFYKLSRHVVKIRLVGQQMAEDFL